MGWTATHRTRLEYYRTPVVRVTTPSEFFDRSRRYTLEGVAQRIACPVLVSQEAGEHFNPGQAEKLAAALGERDPAIVYGGRVGCLSLAYRSVRTDERRVLDWCTQVLNAPQTSLRGDGNRARHQQRKQKTRFDERQNPRSRSVARDNWCQQFEKGASCHCSRRVEPAIQQPSEPWHHDRQSCLCRHRIHNGR